MSSRPKNADDLHKVDSECRKSMEMKDKKRRAEREHEKIAVAAFRRRALQYGDADRVSETPLAENAEQEYFKESDSHPHSYVHKKKSGHLHTYDNQGKYTVEDYYALDDDQRRELIDGVFYDMASPSALHQAIVLELGRRLSDAIEQNQGNCRVFISPFDVQLDRDNRTMVEPDLMVICDREKLTHRNCFGAPDLVIEILSPSTAQRDLILKLGKYRKAGVREYWIVDPKQKQVLVYPNLPAVLEPKVYDFTQKIPVGIWEGRCEVDFAMIFEKIGDLYEIEV